MLGSRENHEKKSRKTEELDLQITGQGTKISPKYRKRIQAGNCAKRERKGCANKRKKRHLLLFPKSYLKECKKPSALLLILQEEGKLKKQKERGKSSKEYMSIPKVKSRP